MTRVLTWWRIRGVYTVKLGIGRRGTGRTLAEAMASAAVSL